ACYYTQCQAHAVGTLPQQARRRSLPGHRHLRGGGGEAPAQALHRDGAVLQTAASVLGDERTHSRDPRAAYGGTTARVSVALITRTGTAADSFAPYPRQSIRREPAERTWRISVFPGPAAFAANL